MGDSERKMNSQLTNKEIMKKYGIKNRSQIETWVIWYRANELHRFDQPIGKQYSYGNSPEFTSEVEKNNRSISRKIPSEIYNHDNFVYVECTIIQCGSSTMYLLSINDYRPV